MIELVNNADHVFLRRHALAVGYDDRDLRDALRRKVITRIRHGAYVETARWAEADPAERFRLRGRAVLRSHGDQAVALSHTSAAVEYGVATWGCSYDHVHLTCLDRAVSRTTGDVIYHAGTWQPDDVWQIDEHLLSAPRRAALETASLLDVEPGVAVLDSFLDHGWTVPAELNQEAEHWTRWPRGRKLRVTVPLARNGAQSVGESRLRYLCWRHHIPAPVLQFPVRDRSGHLVATSDFAWPAHGLLGEFDGRVKYSRFLRPGESAADAVVREKIREDRIREITGWQMIRFVWADLSSPSETASRLRAMLRSQAA